MNQTLDDLGRNLRERADAIVVVPPAAEEIMRRGDRRRRRRGIATGGAAIVLLVAAVAGLVTRPSGPTIVAGRDGSDSSPLPVVPQIVLDQWHTTYFIAMSDASHYVEYQFGKDAMSLQVSFYGERDLASRAGEKERRSVMLRGTAGSLLDYGGGRYRVDWVEGGRTWEADGSPFASAGTFLATVTSVKTTSDPAAWEATLPPGTVLPSSRSKAVDDLLRDVVVPDGLDVERLRHGSAPASKYTLGVEILGQGVTCTWIATWGAAPAGSSAAREAVAALQGSHHWAGLVAMQQEGDYPAVLWDLADRVAQNDRSVLGMYQSALGC